MQVIQLRSRSSENLRARLGTHPTPDDAALVLRSGNAKVYKPDGKPLLVVLRAALTPEAAGLGRAFYGSLRDVTTTNRGNVSGGKWEFKVLSDGRRSKTMHAPPIRSATIGYLDRVLSRVPFCRPSHATRNDPEGWRSVYPVFQEVSALFKAHLPDRWAAQQAQASKAHPAWVVPGTCFTSGTVNNTHASGLHVDAGDYPDGFGAMSVFRRGEYQGAELVIPAYRVAVDLHDRDVILFDVHEVHGNLPFHHTVGEALTDYERIGCVYYFRERMAECGSPEDELRFAQSRGAVDADGDGAEELATQEPGQP